MSKQNTSPDPAERILATRKKIFIGGIIATAVMIVVAKTSDDSPPRPTTTPAQATQSAQREYYAAQGALLVQSEMRNPGSFQLITVGDMQSGALCYEYRSQNGFGGMSAGKASLVHNRVELKQSFWKANCAGKPGTDITEGAKGMLDLARTAQRSGQ